MKSEKGFGVVGFLALLPLLVSVLAAIAGGAMMLKADAHLKHECRTSVLKSQRSVAETLRSLMDLNPRAQDLRNQRAAAEEAVQAAYDSGIPQVIFAAEAKLALVESLQTIFAVKQKALIAKANITNLAAAQAAQMKIAQGLREELADGQIPHLQQHSRPPRLDLRATPEGDLTPDYNPAPGFSRSQSIDIDVKVELASLMPAWLRELLPTTGLEIESHCNATIAEKEDQWIETLNAVK